MRWVNQGQPKTHPFTDFRYLNLRFLIKNVFFPPKLNRNSKIPLWKWKNFRLNSSISHINQKFQIICSSWIAAKLVKKKPDIKPFFLTYFVWWIQPRRVFQLTPRLDVGPSFPWPTFPETCWWWAWDGGVRESWERIDDRRHHRRPSPCFEWVRDSCYNLRSNNRRDH